MEKITNLFKETEKKFKEWKKNYKEYKFCYSTDQEIPFQGSCSCIEEVIEEINDEETETRTFLVGIYSNYEPGTLAYRIIEQIQEDSYDTCGESAEDFLDDVSKEQEDELQDLLDSVLLRWILKYDLTPNFWEVEKYTEVDLDDPDSIAKAKKYFDDYFEKHGSIIENNANSHLEKNN